MDAIIALLERNDIFNPTTLEHYWGGLVNTVQLVFLSLVIGLVLAVPLAIMRTSKKPWINWPVWCFHLCVSRYAAADSALYDLLRRNADRRHSGIGLLGDLRARLLPLPDCLCIEPPPPTPRRFSAAPSRPPRAVKSKRPRPMA